MYSSSCVALKHVHVYGSPGSNSPCLLVRWNVLDMIFIYIINFVQIDMLVMIIVLDEENENGSADIFVFEFRANLVL